MIKKEILNSVKSSTTSTNTQSVYYNTEIPTTFNPFDPIMQEMAEIKMMLRQLLDEKNKVEEKSDLIDVNEASKLIHMSVSSIYKKTSTKSIPFIKRTGSNKLIFSRTNLSTWLQESEGSKANVVEEHLHRNLRMRKVQNN